MPPSAAYVRAHRGESCILECPVPRNVLLDPSVDLIALTVTSAWMYLWAGGPACMRPPCPSAAVRLVFCVLTFCVCICPTAPNDLPLDVYLDVDVVVARPAASPFEDTAGLVRTCIPSDMGIRTVSYILHDERSVAIVARSKGSSAKSPVIRRIS